MTIVDGLYGRINITEPVILEIINTKALQRLKGIDQTGYGEVYFPGKKITRFEHSVGVYYLLKLFLAKLPEQIAGLIHDVSHATFSHTIDYVLGGERAQKYHDHQDNVFEDFILKTEIPAVLKKHGYEISYFLKDENFPLKEKLLPDLCADRLDYALRTAVVYGEISLKEAQNFLANLSVIDQSWVFKDFENARNFAKLFYKLNNQYYAGLNSMVMHQTVSTCLRYALDQKYLTFKDFYGTDEEVLAKIKQHLKTDPKLNFLFARMNNQTPVVEDKINFEAHMFTKSRAVDPKFLEGKKIRKLSEVEIAWKGVLAEELKPKEYFFSFKKKS